MKIIMVSTDYLPNIGGVASHIYNLSKALVNLGHEVHVVNPRYNVIYESIIDNGIFVHYINIKSNLKKIRYLKYSFLVKNYIKKNIGNFDILHQHDFIASNLACLLSVTFKHCWIWTNHTSTFLMSIRNILKRKVVKYFYNNVNAIICPSEELKLFSEKIWNQKKIFFIPNGVDTKKFLPENKEVIDKRRFELGFEKVNKIVLCPRRWVPKNGVIYLVKAISLLKKQNLIDRKVKFIFIGSENKVDSFDEYRKKIMSIIKNENLYDNIVLIPKIPHKLMHIYNSIADIVVIPSLMEAVSLSALEAMSSGKVVIATNVGGLPQIIKDKETGILISPKDEHELAKAIHNLLNNQKLSYKIGKKARKFVEKNYSWEQIAIKTLEVYNRSLYSLKRK